MDFGQCGVDVLRDALCGDAWFCNCPVALQDALLAHSRPRRLAAGEALYRQGEPPLQALYPVLKVSQGLLAQMMGASRQSINAALRELEASKIIAQRYRAIEVLDLSGLMRHAEVR